MKIELFDQFQTQASMNGLIYYFSGNLDSPMVAALADTLKERLQEEGLANATRRKLFSTFVEMAQNILHYGAPSGETTTGKPGAIGMGREGDQFWVVCGNLVLSEHIARLTEKLNAVRSMSLDEIKAQYRKQLANEEHSTQDTISKGAGLGLLTIARDSTEPIEFTFAADPASSGRYAYFYIKAVV
ncbi:hypothetical protein IP84_08805 [beta proteobacterium AAP99]|nr:hypothetical protein IP84_08805 [beta proteobacterium AAP99]